MKHILLLFALISLFHISSSAQSIYGNVADFHESNSLDFANVEIFKDEELVASLITVGHWHSLAKGIEPAGIASRLQLGY